MTDRSDGAIIYPGRDLVQEHAAAVEARDKFHIMLLEARDECAALRKRNAALMIELSIARGES